MKVNVDGAVSSMLHASCGGIFRDANGFWLKGFSWNLDVYASTNVFLTELMAVKLVVEAAMGQDLPRLIVETDSMDVVNLLNSQDVSVHHYAQIAMEIHHLQRAHGALVFQHTSPESNSLADYLAKIGLDLQFGPHCFDSPFEKCHSLLVMDACPSSLQPDGAGKP